MSDHALQKLCELLEDELERQENVLAVCIAQGEAARARDIELLEARATALTRLIEDAVKAEPLRLQLVHEVVQSYGLQPEQQTLSGLIAAAPEPWSGRLALFQQRIREVLGQIRVKVRENNALVRRSLNRVNKTLNALMPPERGRAPLYTASGSHGLSSGPGFLDSRG